MLKINYKEYPEYMFAIIAAYLPMHEGHELRRISGSVVFRSEDVYGNTYKNGLLHSYDDKPAYTNFSCKRWYKDGKIHRDNDLPADINGENKIWYKNGKIYRDGDKPAFIDDDFKAWCKDGKIYREGDKPAVIDWNVKKWYLNGKIGREGDKPALIIVNSSDLLQGVNDKSDDLPDIIDDGYKYVWYVDGVRHRDGGLPAVITRNRKEWWFFGELISSEDYN
jgi:hypothetical protein